MRDVRICRAGPANEAMKLTSDLRHARFVPSYFVRLQLIAGR